MVTIDDCADRAAGVPQATPWCRRPDRDPPGAFRKIVDVRVIAAVPSRPHELWASKREPAFSITDHMKWQCRIAVLRCRLDRYGAAKLHQVGNIDADPGTPQEPAEMTRKHPRNLCEDRIGRLQNCMFLRHVCPPTR